MSADLCGAVRWDRSRKDEGSDSQSLNTTPELHLDPEADLVTAELWPKDKAESQKKAVQTSEGMDAFRSKLGEILDGIGASVEYRNVFVEVLGKPLPKCEENLVLKLQQAISGPFDYFFKSGEAAGQAPDTIESAQYLGHLLTHVLLVRADHIAAEELSKFYAKSNSIEASELLPTLKNFYREVMQDRMSPLPYMLHEYRHGSAPRFMTHCLKGVLHGYEVISDAVPVSEFRTFFNFGLRDRWEKLLGREGGGWENSFLNGLVSVANSEVIARSKCVTPSAELRQIFQNFDSSKQHPSELLGKLEKYVSTKETTLCDLNYIERSLLGRYSVADNAYPKLARIVSQKGPVKVE